MVLFTKDKSFPIRGGVNTHLEKALIPFGGYSEINNFLPTRPGAKQRKGIKEHNKTGDASTEIISLHQYVQASIDEKRFYRQLVDGSLQVSTNNPPATIDGTFGSDILPAIANPLPATSSVLDDFFVYSDGVRQHIIGGGTAAKIEKFIVFKGSAAIPEIPTGGEDYSKEVRDGDPTTVAALDSLSTLANFDSLFVGTEIAANGIGFTISAANGTTSVLAGKYRKNDSTWAAMSGFSDGTASGGASMAQTAQVTWTSPTDEVPHYMFGRNLFWYQLYLSSGALDSDTKVSAMSFQGPAQAIQNMWDGTFVDAIEAIFEDASTSAKATYAGSSITIGDMTTTDVLYFNSTDPLWAIWVECSGTPNTESTTTIAQVSYWTGQAFVDAVETDNTSGFSEPGFITWGRKTNQQKRQFGNSKIYSYWYKITIGVAAVSTDAKISIQTLPYFDIGDLGKLGNVNCAWKERMVYASNLGIAEVLISGLSRPMVLNGFGYDAVRVGDGRRNDIKSMKPFYNELIVWQEELGQAGGCTTLIEGYSPTTYGRLVLDDKIGILNSKCSVVINGVLAGTQTDSKLQTIAIWVSKYGVFMFDGNTIISISNDIQNYFDPTHSTYIRRGYEDKHWIHHDTTNSVIVFGLVSGSSATLPNVFLQYDYADALATDSPGVFRGWSHRTYAQGLSCMREIEADSGDVSILTMAGGSTSGKVYRTNTGTSDLSTTTALNDTKTAIDASITQEFNGEGKKIQFENEIFRCKARPTTAVNIDNAAAVDAGGGSVDITIAAHGFEAGWTLDIAGTMNYDGEHTGIAIPDANTIRITATFAAETFTGGGAETAQQNPKITRTVAIDANTSFGDPITSSMKPLVVNDSYRRIIEDFKKEGHHLSIKYQNNVIDEEMFLLDSGYLMSKNKAQV